MSPHNLSEQQLRARILKFAPDYAGRESLFDQDVSHAVSIIQHFNDRIRDKRKILWVPTVVAALLSLHHWLHVRCSGCGKIKAVDLTVVNRPPNMPVTDILPSLRCRDCGRRHPPPSIVRLSRSHWDKRRQPKAGRREWRPASVLRELASFGRSARKPSLSLSVAL